MDLTSIVYTKGTTPSSALLVPCAAGGASFSGAVELTTATLSAEPQVAVPVWVLGAGV